MSSDPNLTISIIIPVYNGGEDFRCCLASVAELRPGPDEVIVVADGDTDGSGQLAEAVGARVVRTPVRGGPARARNLGAHLARGGVLFFLDADTAVHPDALGQVISVLREDSGVAAVFGSYDDAPAAPGFLSQYKNLFHHYVHQTAHEEASTFWGACGAIRREVFLGLGGLDEQYREPCIEDIELGYRLRQAGHRIRLLKTLQTKHLKPWSLVSLLRADFLRRAVPWTELILRDRCFVNDLNLRLSSRASVVAMYLWLGALAGGFWWPASLVLAGALALLLLALNAPLYRFFSRKRGVLFALCAIPWHWFYLFYSGLAFVVGTICFLIHSQRVLPRRTTGSKELSYTGGGLDLP